MSPEEITDLKSWVRSHTIESRYATRAQIVLMSVEGKSMDQIGKSLNVTKATVNKWRNRFRKNGINAMDDLPRVGKPAVISAETYIPGLSASIFSLTEPFDYSFFIGKIYSFIHFIFCSDTQRT